MYKKIIKFDKNTRKSDQKISLLSDFPVVFVLFLIKNIKLFP
ncbi:Uncharacterized protein dnm_034490 [Desulfonema magnum]|uniref:Uncharacterized protein n=1 Tax=Desulfonema magnum TaxID=45655 RepID=A0A975GMX8_9BACT|nr:Uncharacterized protein dnm_034490 [Desulfonema magnum]